MTLDEIKSAVLAGKRVCWGNPGYVVLCDAIGQWLIKFTANGHCFGLTDRSGRLECKESEFFIHSEVM